MANVEAPLHPGKLPKIVTRNGVRIREDVLNTDSSGNDHVLIRTRADRAFECLGNTLKRIVKADETVLYLFGAHTRRGLIQLILRRFSFLADTLLVITDKRVIALRLWSGTLGMKWTGSIRSVAWTDITNAKMGTFLIPTLNLRFGNGQQDSYWKIQRYDAKKIQVLVGSPILDVAGKPSATQGASALCPRCLQILVPRKYTCWRCHLAFKTEKHMWLRTLLVPGGGYWYTGFVVSGVLVGAFEAFVLGYTLLMALGKSGVGWAHTFGEKDPEVLPSQAPFIIFFTLATAYALLLSPFKILSILRCRPYIRDFLPVIDPAEIR